MKRSQRGIAPFVIKKRILRKLRKSLQISGSIFFSELVVDEYFAEICKASKANEVDFEPSGSWKEHREKKEKKPKQDFAAESTQAAKPGKIYKVIFFF